MKLLLISDAWDPQTNGVVTTYKNVIAEMKKKGVTTTVIHPGLFVTFPCPGYSEIKLVVNFWKLKKLIKQANPDSIHVAVEGPLGIAAKRYLDKTKTPYTTAFHTRFPEYVNERFSFVSVKFLYGLMRWFHGKSKAVMVTTKSMKKDLDAYDIKNMIVWGRGVDTDKYQPLPEREESTGQEVTYNKEPIFINVGRVAVEKNIEAFLKLDLSGKKVVVGDGPSRKSLEKKYPDVEFLGYKYGEELAECYAKADVFVFPSKTDTFGLVMLEAMACGTPVAAYPVVGPVDVIKDKVTGVMDTDLQKACLEALKLSREDCRDYALDNNWSACAERLRINLAKAK